MSPWSVDRDNRTVSATAIWHLFATNQRITLWFGFCTSCVYVCHLGRHTSGKRLCVRAWGRVAVEKLSWIERPPYYMRCQLSPSVKATPRFTLTLRIGRFFLVFLGGVLVYDVSEFCCHHVFDVISDYVASWLVNRWVVMYREFSWAWSLATLES